MTAITDKLGVNSWGMYFNPSKFSFQDFKQRWDYDLSMINKLPINWIRIGYTFYDDGFNSDGTYNFERLDYAIQTSQDLGFKVILPIWFVDDGINDKTNIDYKSYYVKWLDMIKAIVIRYTGKGIYYEAIDEATSGGHFWLNQPITGDDIINDILLMNRRFFEYTTAFDSSSKFINGDFAAPNQGAYQAIAKGMLSYGDYVSFHHYVMSIPENLIDATDQVQFRNTLVNTGMKLSSTEFGFGTPSAFNGKNTREEQASKLLREVFVLDMLGFEQIIQFTMDGSDKTWILQSDDYTFNQSGKLMQSMMFELNGYTFSERLSSDDDYILRYSKHGEVDKIVYWTTGTKHYNGSYYLTQTPKIVDLDGATKNSENKYDSIKLTRLSSLEILNNFQGNLDIILGAFEEVNSFLETYGFEYSSESFDKLEQYDQLDRNFLFGLQTEIEKIDQTINQYSAIFENTSWLEGGHYDNYPGHSLFDTGDFQYTLNQYWNKFESNMNVLLGIINTLQRRTYE